MFANSSNSVVIINKEALQKLNNIYEENINNEY